VRFEILSAESLGVRGLCCRVEVGDRVIVIDPGVALGDWRYGLPPHPVQVAVGRAARQRIVSALESATDVVFSHFHGDHVPLLEANPYQLAFSQLPPSFKSVRAWCLSPDGQTHKSQARARDLMDLLGTGLQVAEELEDGPLLFSAAMPHGTGGLPFGDVMLTRIDLGRRVFVHASDIQLLDDDTVNFIIDWAPDVLIAAGPPLYQKQLDGRERARAWENALRLGERIDNLILDHHLLRSMEGAIWLERLSTQLGRTVHCAADFMGRPRRLLEAQRRELYAAMPVRAHWHEDYAHGLSQIEDFGPLGGERNAGQSP
jgi:predicted metallo-beta-lactamase superfamily hydrolase